MLHSSLYVNGYTKFENIRIGGSGHCAMDHLDPCTQQQSLEYINQRGVAGEIEVKPASLVLMGTETLQPY